MARNCSIGRCFHRRNARSTRGLNHFICEGSCSEGAFNGDWIILYDFKFLLLRFQPQAWSIFYQLHPWKTKLQGRWVKTVEIALFKICNSLLPFFLSLLLLVSGSFSPPLTLMTIGSLFCQYKTTWTSDSQFQTQKERKKETLVRKTRLWSWKNMSAFGIGKWRVKWIIHNSGVMCSGD